MLAVIADRVENPRHSIRCACREYSLHGQGDDVKFLQSADQRAADGYCFPCSVGSELDQGMSIPSAMSARNNNAVFEYKESVLNSIRNR